MDVWDEHLKLEKIKALADGNLVLFFKKDDDYFGCPEESRLVFAKLKNPDEDADEGWADEAAFLALNLSRALSDDYEEPPKKLFYKKDLDDLKMVDKEEVDKILFKNV